LVGRRILLLTVFSRSKQYKNAAQCIGAVQKKESQSFYPALVLLEWFNCNDWILFRYILSLTKI